MPNDTGDFELEPTKKTWGEGIETRGEDSWTKTVTIEVVDASMPSKHELGENGNLQPPWNFFQCRGHLSHLYPACTFANALLA
jgi:hypothetical protein